MSFTEDCRQILYLEASINYTYIKYSNGRVELKSSTLKKVHDSLENLAFIRIHRKYSINQEFIKTLSADKVEMANGKVLPIARRRKFVPILKQ